MRATQVGPRRRCRSAVGLIAIAGIVVTVTAPANASGEQSGSIRVWTHQNQSFNDSLQALADEYIEANPDVEIEFETFDYDTYIQTLQTALPAGTEADILQMFGDWTCGYSSNLATVPEEVATVDSATPMFFEAPLDGYTCGDQLYGFPMEFNIEYGAALVNTRIAEEAGVDLDAGFESWDQFTEAAVAMAEGEPGNLIRSGFHFTTNDGMSHMFLAGIVQQGGSYLNEDGTAFTFDTPEARATLEVMKAIIDAGANDPVLFGDTTNWVGDCFFVEDCAMGLIGPWVIGEYRADYPDIVEISRYVPLPLFEGATEPNFVADSGWGMTVSSNSENQELAWDFIRFVALDEANAVRWNTDTGTIPALRANVEGDAATALVEQFPQFGPFVELLPYGQYVGDIPDRDLLYYEIIVPHVLAVLDGSESIDDAVVAMEREATETLSG